jgi:hypothetical protein
MITYLSLMKGIFEIRIKNLRVNRIASEGKING